MRRPLLAATAVAALLIGGCAATSSSTTSTVGSGPVSSTKPGRVTAAKADSTVTSGTVRLASLAHPVHGEAAVHAAGSSLSTIAAAHHMSTPALRSALRSDKTLWINRTGKLYYQEEIPSASSTADPTNGGTVLPALSKADTFALHSKPGASRTIYLDFDGASISGTAWNSQYPALTTGALPGYDTDGNPSTFSTTELSAIRTMWAEVAEDYAAWDVDVTTVNPGTAALSRSSTADTSYGTTAVITSGTTASSVLCSNNCGGLAYVGVFGNPSYAPAFVFSSLTSTIAYTGAAIAHEVGHNLGLSHDGVKASASSTAAGYYTGANGWAPIMGAAFYPISQWSKGSYPNANNSEDDLAIITKTLPLRTDEAGSTVATAGGTSVRSGVITSAADIDVVDLGTCNGLLSLSTSSPTTLPDLDVSLTLLNSSGTALTSANPASAGSYGAGTSSGMTASLSYPTSGHVYASISGSGRGTWATLGYDGYGSIGQWQLSSTCGTDPDAVTALTGTTAASSADGTAITVGWKSPGRTDVTGYQVSLDGTVSTVAGAAATSTTVTKLAPGSTHTLMERAVTATRTGPWVQETVTTASPVGTVSAKAAASSANVAWSIANGYPASAVSSWTVTTSSPTTTTSTAKTVSSVTVSKLLAGTTATVAVTANLTSGTKVTLGTATVTPYALPGTPTIGTAAAGVAGGDITATAVWTAPASNGGLPIIGYDVVAYRYSGTTLVQTAPVVRVDPTVRSSSVTLPTSGSWRFAVRAVTSGGTGAWSAASNLVTGQ